MPDAGARSQDQRVDEETRRRSASERKSAEDAVRTARELLRRMQIAHEHGQLDLEEFAATAARRLDQPLDAVRRFARALQTNADPTDHEARAFAARLDHEAAQMQAKIRSLIEGSDLGSSV
jgi:signal transduction histidine kinase